MKRPLALNVVVRSVFHPRIFPERGVLASVDIVTAVEIGVNARLHDVRSREMEAISIKFSRHVVSHPVCALLAFMARLTSQPTGLCTTSQSFSGKALFTKIGNF